MLVCKSEKGRWLTNVACVFAGVLVASEVCVLARLAREPQVITTTENVLGGQNCWQAQGQITCTAPNPVPPDCTGSCSCPYGQTCQTQPAYKSTGSGGFGMCPQVQPPNGFDSPCGSTGNNCCTWEYNCTSAPCISDTSCYNQFVKGTGYRCQNGPTFCASGSFVSYTNKGNPCPNN